MFLHDAVFSETIICGETEIPANEFEIKLQELNEIDSSTGCSGLQSQFDLLCQVTPDPDDATEFITIAAVSSQCIFIYYFTCNTK